MKFLFDGFDLMLAVVARRTLLYEFTNHSNENRANLVLEPHKDFLADMARGKPSQITCFFGHQFQFQRKPGCVGQSLYVVNQKNRVAYIGTVFNPEAIAQYRARLPEKKRKFLSDKNVSRGRLMYWIIPTQKEKIDEVILVESAKKFFASFPKKTLIPNLTNALICLLSAEKGAKLEEEILKQARLTAKPVSRKEKLKKFMEDEDMVW